MKKAYSWKDHIAQVCGEATRKFPHSPCGLRYSQIHFTDAFVVLVNSRTQQILPAKQTTSIIKIQVNQSSDEAQLFWGGYQEDFSLRSTWPRSICLINFPHPWGKLSTYNPPGPTPGGSRWHVRWWRTFTQSHFTFLCLLGHFLFI